MASQNFVKVAFRLHAFYFFFWAAFFELMPRAVMGWLGLEMPDNPIGWVAANVAAGGLLTAGALFFLASRHKRVPRIALGAALVQTAFNLYHDAVWLVGFRNQPQLWLVVLDTVIIASLFLVYVRAWRTAEHA